MAEDERTEVQLPPQLNALADVVAATPESFAQGSDEMQKTALDAVKFLFDLSLQSEPTSLPHITKFLDSLNPSAAPQTRAQSSAKEKKQAQRESKFKPFKPTELIALYTDDMGEDQIWAQLDLRAERVAKMLESAVKEEGSDEEEVEEGPVGDEADMLKAMEDEFGEFDSEDDDEDDDDSEDEDEDDSEEEEEEEEDVWDSFDMGEAVAPLRDPSSEPESESELFPASKKAKRSKSKKLVKDKFGLNDGFFDIDAFNNETEAAEARSAGKGSLRDDLDDGSDEDDEEMEEEFDFFAPVGGKMSFDEEDLEEGGGHTFGAMDEDEDEEAADAGDILYTDFFDPPPKVPSTHKSKPASSPSSSPKKKAGGVRFHEEVKVKSIKRRGKSLPLNGLALEDDDDEDEDEDGYGELGMGMLSDEEDEDDEDEDEEPDEDEDDDDEDEVPAPKSKSKKRKHMAELDEDMEMDDEEDDFAGQHTIDRFKDDLFASDDEADPAGELTQHEKRQASLKAQITALEAENVAPKDWVLGGETTSRSRPKNSTLEADLDFDRTLKPTPVITEEVVHDLEERIKARILAGDFDDVVRRRVVEEKAFLPSRLIELKDTRDKEGLGKSYEDEFMAAQGAALAGVDDRDGKLAKEHTELEGMWEGICAKLDALCNAHYTPKQPKTTISSISNVATASLESAMPTTQSIATMLAPEEVFAPSPSSLRSKSELTPQEKKVARTKDRKQKKKMREAVDKAKEARALNGTTGKKVRGIGGVKREKEKALESMVKSGKGVTVVGKPSAAMEKGKKGSARQKGR